MDPPAGRLVVLTEPVTWRLDLRPGGPLAVVRRQPSSTETRSGSLPKERVERDEEDLVRLYLTDIGHQLYVDRTRRDPLVHASRV